MERPDVQLFFVPAWGPEARSQLQESISAPIRIDLTSFLTTERLGAAKASDGMFYAWAAKMGPKNQKTWSLMQQNDYCAFYTLGTYSYVAAVTSTEHNPDLGKAIWGEGPDGSVFEFIYFLEKPVRVDIPLEHLSDYLQGGRYQGFIQLSDARREKILGNYGSIRTFVMDRFLSLSAAPANHLILRMNADSEWRDSHDSYHYGKIANYLKLRPGSAVILDRKTAKGAELIGSGRVTDIIELEDGTFEAKLDRVPIDPRPYGADELAKLRAQAGYNVQHSIRPISAELFRVLSGDKPPQTGLSLEDRLSAIHELVGWSVERVRALYTTLAEARTLLLAGPPGTGKTFLAQALRENLTDDDSDSEIVVFHPSYAYEDFIQGIRPQLDGDRLGYELHNGVFYRLAERASLHPGRPFIIIIDELNRGNVPKIFGEILFSLEYRDREHSIALASGSSFSIPSNLWIIATMNTADRSVMGLDSALRRRFRQVTLEPDYDVLAAYLDKTYGVTDTSTRIDACDRLKQLNEELLAILNDRGRLIGHYFLMVGDLSPERYLSIWSSQIEPVVAEYLFEQPDDVARLADIFLRK